MHFERIANLRAISPPKNGKQSNSASGHRISVAIFHTILIVMLSLLVVAHMTEITAMGSKRLDPVFRNRVILGRMMLHGLVVLVLTCRSWRNTKRSDHLVKLDKIYTRGGDNGETSLAGGKRIAKHDLRVAAMGTVDESNASIGLVRHHLTGEPDALMGRVQNDLFDLGADLARPDESDGGLKITSIQVERLETEIDSYNRNLAPLTSFVLPGGTPAAAHLHHARTVTRRAERLVSNLRAHEWVNDHALSYLNRLSDLLFVLARAANREGATDVLWVPGENRD